MDINIIKARHSIRSLSIRQDHRLIRHLIWGPLNNKNLFSSRKSILNKNRTCRMMIDHQRTSIVWPAIKILIFAYLHAIIEDPKVRGINVIMMLVTRFSILFRGWRGINLYTQEQNLMNVILINASNASTKNRI